MFGGEDGDNGEEASKPTGGVGYEDASARVPSLISHGDRNGCREGTTETVREIHRRMGRKSAKGEENNQHAVIKKLNRTEENLNEILRQNGAHGHHNEIILFTNGPCHPDPTPP